MINTLLITGCTKGLGQSLALKFAQQGCHVYAVGRNKNLLEKLSDISNLIHPIIADITTEQGRKVIFEKMNSSSQISIIHNAAIIEPMQFSDLSESVLRKHIETNLLAPILITQQLMPFLTEGQRIIHISSGAADLALSGLMPYCITKSALESLTHCLNKELNARGIFCANLRPGMMKTSMQSILRDAEENVLPNRDFYIQARKNNTLIKTEIVADFIAWVMLQTNNTLFSETLWNIYDSTYHPAWLFSRSLLDD